MSNASHCPDDFLLVRHEPSLLVAGSSIATGFAVVAGSSAAFGLVVVHCPSEKQPSSPPPCLLGLLVEAFLPRLLVEPSLPAIGSDQISRSPQIPHRGTIVGIWDWGKMRRYQCGLDVYKARVRS
jgi:hypothetical protein